MSTKLKIILLLLFSIQGAVFYWSYFDKEQAIEQKLAPYKKYLDNPLAVKSIDFSKQNLEVLPIDILQFPNLESINLSNNRFKSIPTEIFKIPNLKTLDLSYNQFSIIKKLPPMMEKLILNHNEIYQLSFKCEEADCQSKLKYLDLSNNKFAEIPDLRKIKLDSIIAYYNLFEDFTFSQAKLPSNHTIKYLDLSYNKRLYYYSGSMHELPSRCTSLNLSYNNNMSFPYELFKRNGVLKNLSLVYNNFQEEFDLFPSSNIESLDLTDANLFFNNRTPFQTCFNIKKLNLSGLNTYHISILNSGLEYLSVEALNQKELNLPNLKTISFDAFDLEKLIKHKASFPKLEKIILRKYKNDNYLARNKLAVAFPNAKIEIESFL